MVINYITGLQYDVDEASLQKMKAALTAEGAVVEIIAPYLGNLKSKKGIYIKIYKSFLTTASVLYDAVYIPGGIDSIKVLMAEADAIQFINQAFKHCKAIAADAEAV